MHYAVVEKRADVKIVALPHRHIPSFDMAAVAGGFALLVALAACLSLAGLAPATQPVASRCIRGELHGVLDLLQVVHRTLGSRTSSSARGQARASAEGAAS